jgi:predicted nucleic acid-binding protein
MIAECFLDTNVLVYAAIGRYSEPEKYARAREVIENTHFGISGQVLAEFYVNATKKSDVPLTSEQAYDWIEKLRDRPCAAMDHELVTNAIRYSGRYQTSYWDAALIAAAERLGAPILYTEDLNHGQSYGPVKVINPFLSN